MPSCPPPSLWQVHVPDVARKDGVCFLRPNGAPPSGGTYLALPIAGVDGETVGLLGIDTVAGADGGGGGGGAGAPCARPSPRTTRRETETHHASPWVLCGAHGVYAEAGPLQLGEEDADFLRALAKAISDAVVQDQQALATLVDQVHGHRGSTAARAPGHPARPRSQWAQQASPRETP